MTLKPERLGQQMRWLRKPGLSGASMRKLLPHARRRACTGRWAFTCISRTSQYPLGSAQAGTGWRAALATAGLAFFSVAVNTRVSPAVSAELTESRAAITPCPCPCFQVLYCWLQLTGTRALPWLAGAAVGGAVWLQAVSPAMAAPAAARMMRFNTCSVRSVAPYQGEYTTSTQ